MTSQPDMLAPPARPTADYLDALNSAQRAAVEAADGPLLARRGRHWQDPGADHAPCPSADDRPGAAASGACGHLHQQGRARDDPARPRLLERSVEGLWLGTFHALGARLLRRHAELVGLKANFTILDTDDQPRLEAGDRGRRSGPASLVAARPARAHRALERSRPNSRKGAGIGHRRLRARACAPALCRLPGASRHAERLRLRRPPAAWLDPVRRTPGDPRRLPAALPGTLVDEYQYSNVAQYLWLRLLAQRHRNLTCVGDDDQSIYSWRGAEVGNILRFEQDFPRRGGAPRVHYRSTGHILGAASGLIAHNRSRLGKTLWTEGEAGERVRIASLWDDQEEARFVGEEIEAEQRAGRALNDIAVLVRAGFQTRAFEERFDHLSLPYDLIGATDFTSAPTSAMPLRIFARCTSQTMT